VIQDPRSGTSPLMWHHWWRRLRPVSDLANCNTMQLVFIFRCVCSELMTIMPGRQDNQVYSATWTVHARLTSEDTFVPMWHGALRDVKWFRRCYTWMNNTTWYFSVSVHPNKHYCANRVLRKGLTSQAVHKSVIWYSPCSSILHHMTNLLLSPGTPP
jgi:hypothetical protein